MKKVITIILDASLAKELFEDYHDLADFISIETEAEHYMNDAGWKTWDGDETGYDDEEEDCDCTDKRKVEI
jgi:hypothetical protein